jgi:hypothetical protein
MAVSVCVPISNAPDAPAVHESFTDTELTVQQLSSILDSMVASRVVRLRCTFKVQRCYCRPAESTDAVRPNGAAGYSKVRGTRTAVADICSTTVKVDLVAGLDTTATITCALNFPTPTPTNATNLLKDPTSNSP